MSRQTVLNVSPQDNDHPVDLQRKVAEALARGLGENCEYVNDANAHVVDFVAFMPVGGANCVVNTILNPTNSGNSVNGEAFTPGIMIPVGGTSITLNSGKCFLIKK